MSVLFSTPSVNTKMIHSPTPLAKQGIQSVLMPRVWTMLPFWISKVGGAALCPQNTAVFTEQLARHGVGDSGDPTVSKALCMKTHWGWAGLSPFFQIQKLRHSKK